jgi:hypothetical protein
VIEEGLRTALHDLSLHLQIGADMGSDGPH